MEGGSRPHARAPSGHRAFTLVLAGGGARGFAHVGVLKAMEDLGLRPSALVGVSMGAFVSATYAAREDWYETLLDLDTSGFPHPMHADGAGSGAVFKQAAHYVHTAWNLLAGWGAPESSVRSGRTLLTSTLGSTSLEGGRVPVAVCATDLISGGRVTLRDGNAVEAVYASAALAGVLPPLPRGAYLLADGAYADIAPIDVAREFGFPAVLVVDPGQAAGPARVANGLQSLMRAMEICHLRHAELRMGEADFVIHPRFYRPIDVLDFDARGECHDAGFRAVERCADELRRVLELAT